jgi:hypothetical protein
MGTWLPHLEQTWYCAGIEGETRIQNPKPKFTSSTKRFEPKPCISTTAFPIFNQIDQTDFTFLLCCFKSISDFWAQQSAYALWRGQQKYYQKRTCPKMFTKFPWKRVQISPELPLFLFLRLVCYRSLREQSDLGCFVGQELEQD